MKEKKNITFVLIIGLCIVAAAASLGWGLAHFRSGVERSISATGSSSMNYEWNVSQEGTVSGKKAIYMGYSDVKEGSDFIDDVKYIQVVNWYDDLTGVSYSLSASGNDLNGMDIQVYVEQIYDEGFGK